MVGWQEFTIGGVARFAYATSVHDWLQNVTSHSSCQPATSFVKASKSRCRSTLTHLAEVSEGNPISRVHVGPGHIFVTRRVRFLNWQYFLKNLPCIVLCPSGLASQLAELEYAMQDFKKHSSRCRMTQLQTRTLDLDVNKGIKLSLFKGSSPDRTFLHSAQYGEVT